jgi:ribosomal protein S18 acetylase RimI-like enzyme
MPEGRIRRAHPGDLHALTALEAYFPTDRLSRASFRHLLTRGNADVLVFALDTRILGDIVVFYRRGSRTARFYSLVTHPDFRGRGIGSRLLAQAERIARGRDSQRVRLEVRPRNAAAIRLYRERGYEITGRIAGFYEDGTDALRMEKRLARKWIGTQEPRAATSAGRRKVSHRR